MKNVIVTGCSRGIGAAVVRKFLSEGYNVTGLCRSDPAAVRAQFDSPNFVCVQGDLGCKEDREALVRMAKDTFGQIDVLVNVAGVAPKERRDLLEMSEESYDFVMNINTKGTLFLTQAAAKEMIANRPDNSIRGYICNISSLSAYTSSVNRGGILHF